MIDWLIELLISCYCYGETRHVSLDTHRQPNKNLRVYKHVQITIFKSDLFAGQEKKVLKKLCAKTVTILQDLTLRSTAAEGSNFLGCYTTNKLVHRVVLNDFGAYERSVNITNLSIMELASLA
jgi:hypothetical protein